MNRILVVGEDALCCALGERLVESCLPGWNMVTSPVNKAGITKFVPDLPRFAAFSRNSHAAVLCIADTDRGCAKQLVERWRPKHAPQEFLLRLAVTEAESWLLADRVAFSEYFDIPLNRLPVAPDEVPDPTQLILGLIAKSRRKIMRDEIVNAKTPTRAGAGYNLHLGAFARTGWRMADAALSSPSLARAVARLQALGGGKG